MSKQHCLYNTDLFEIEGLHVVVKRNTTHRVAGLQMARPTAINQSLPFGDVRSAVGSFARWQADGKLPKDQQRGYRSVFHALYRIARDEGVLAYWRGGGTTGESYLFLSLPFCCRSCC